MPLQWNLEQSEQWQSTENTVDRQETGTQQSYRILSSSRIQKTTDADRLSMIRAITNVVVIHLIQLFCFWPGIRDLMRLYRTDLWHGMPIWFDPALFAWNVGIIILIAWIIGVMAPRRIVSTVAYAAGINYLISLSYLLFYYLQGAMHATPQLLAQGAFIAFTSAVTEVAIASWFARRMAKNR